jgi:hypothetical protein
LNDYEGLVGNSEMDFGEFPHAALDGAVFAEVVDTGSNEVPVEWGFIGTQFNTSEI